MLHPTKVGYIIFLGQYVSQNNNVLQNWKVRQKFVFNSRLLGVDHPNGIHDVLSWETSFKFLNETSSSNTALLFHSFYYIQTIQSGNITQKIC
jgi:hypothetical protein